MRRIYFLTFVEKFYNVLIKFENNNRVKSNFIFQMIDYDQDG